MMTFTLGPQRKQLGKILLDMGLLSEVSLTEALMEQRLSGNSERLGALLLRRGIISARDYLAALTRQHQALVASR